MEKPRVFIGSSAEGHALAEAVHAELVHFALPMIWSHGVVAAGQFVLEALENAVAHNSFAIMVATPNDLVVKRGTARYAMRDNVLLELGLFVGKWGRRRAFLIIPDKVPTPVDESVPGGASAGASGVFVASDGALDIPSDLGPDQASAGGTVAGMF